MKDQSKWGSFSLIILAIIFGAGILIWTYNYIQGQDLSKPPKFDLSAYDTLTWPTPDELFGGFDEVDDIVDELQGNNAKKGEELANEEDFFDEKEIDFISSSIYFSTFFKNEKADQTKVAVDNFLLDFPQLPVKNYQDLLGQTCHLVELPVNGRLELLQVLTHDEQIFSVEVSVDGAPNYDLCFVTAKYYNEVQEFLTTYGEVNLLKSDVAPGEYIAFFQYENSTPESQATIEQLKKDYSDVVKLMD